MVDKSCFRRAAGRLIVIFGLVAGGMAALTPLAQAAGGGGTLYVNGSTGTDSGTCRLQAHPCQTISYALTQTATDATSTIKVAAGNYPEPLAITHRVTIAGAGDTASGTVIDPSTLISDTDTDSSTPQEAIIDVSVTSGVTLKGLEISGGNAQGDFTGCGEDFVGVYYHDASGTMSKVQVTGIELPMADFGCQDGQGVYVASDSGDTSSVHMTGLNVNAYDKNGVTCDDAGTTCTLGNSKITGIGPTGLIAENGFQGFDAASVTLNIDTIKGNSYTGGNNAEATGALIFDVGTVSVTGSTLTANDVNAYLGSDGTGPQENPWTVSGNTVNNAADNVPGGSPGFGYGIQLDSTSNPVSITSNTVSNSAAYGIALTGASNATVSGNTVSTSGSDGIYVGGPGSTAGATQSSGDLIEDNISHNNQGDGIDADADSASDTFSGNTANFNTTYDLQDAGTSNTWGSNTCKPVHDSSPSGLC
jgi:parallel beta-helix repeat protein